MKNTIIALAASTIALASVNAQTNLLVNGSFEDTVSSLSSGNNIIDASEIPGWNSTTDANNLVLPSPTYFGGPTVADSGQVYFDSASLNFENLYQNFTLTEDSLIEFGGAFSGRTGSGGSYIYDTSVIDILDASGNLVDSLSFGTDPGEGNWITDSATSSRLSAGTYSFNLTIGNFANADSLFVNAIAVPEPSSALLLGLGAFGLLGRRKR